VEQILEPAFTRDKFQSFEAFSWTAFIVLVADNEISRTRRFGYRKRWDQSNKEQNKTKQMPEIACELKLTRRCWWNDLLEWSRRRHFCGNIFPSIHFILNNHSIHLSFRKSCATHVIRGICCRNGKLKMRSEAEITIQE
jgi:hypothetical protein